MLTVDLNLDFVVSDEDRNAPNSFTITNRTISEWMLKRAMDAKLKDGVDRKADGGTLQRQYNVLLKKLTLATKANKNEFQCTVEEVRFLNECFREWKTPPQWLMWAPDVADHIDKIVRDYEAAEEAKKKADQDEVKRKAEAPKA